MRAVAPCSNSSRGSETSPDGDPPSRLCPQHAGQADARRSGRHRHGAAVRLVLYASRRSWHPCESLPLGARLPLRVCCWRRYDVRWAPSASSSPACDSMAQLCLQSAGQSGRAGEVKGCRGPCSHYSKVCPRCPGPEGVGRGPTARDMARTDAARWGGRRRRGAAGWLVLNASCGSLRPSGPLLPGASSCAVPVAPSPNLMLKSENPPALSPLSHLRPLHAGR